MLGSLQRYMPPAAAAAAAEGTHLRLLNYMLVLERERLVETMRRKLAPGNSSHFPASAILGMVSIVGCDDGMYTFSLF
jgi:hypothetical protein